MDTWIYHAQRYFVSGLSDQEALSAALDNCPDQRIRDFLAGFPIKDEDGYHQSVSLYKLIEGKLPKLIALMFINSEDYGLISSPFGIAENKRDHYFDSAKNLADECAKYPVLASSTGLLYYYLATGFSKLRNEPAARQAYEKALALLRPSAGSDLAVQHVLANTLNNLSDFLREVQDFRYALEACEEAISIFNQLSLTEQGTYLPDVAGTLNSLGNLYTEERNFAAAQAAYEKALTITRELYQKDPVEHIFIVTATLANLGVMYRGRHDFVAAAKFYKEALSLYYQLKGKRDSYMVEVARLHYNLSNALREEGEFLEALRHCKKALWIRRKLSRKNRGADFNEISESLNCLGSIYVGLDDIDKAKKAFEEALLLLQKAPSNMVGNCPPGLTQILNNLGNLYYTLGEIVQARGLYEEAVFLAESEFDENQNPHLSKQKALAGYRFLLEDASNSGDNTTAFAMCSALRDGQLLSRNISQNEIAETQKWLARQAAENRIEYLIVTANSSLKEDLILGLIDENDCQFARLDINVRDCSKLFPVSGDAAIPDKEDQLERLQYARTFWQALPNEIQSRLLPENSKRLEILISGDSFWNSFPWELLRFGDADQDYLGLHQALPRIGALRSNDLEAQLGLKQLGNNNGVMNILAPFDTDIYPLTGVLDEVAAVKASVEQFGSKVASIAIGTQASNLAIEDHILSEPDIFYYSGHGAIIQNEEVMVLHRDLAEEKPMSSLFYFGREQLAQLADRNQEKLFPQRPLVVLNSCMTGRSREYGGAREDLVSALLTQGAGAVIATALPIFDSVGQAMGEALFDPSRRKDTEIGSVVVSMRQYLAKGLCKDITTPFWGAWGMIHLHGCTRAKFPIH